MIGFLVDVRLASSCSCTAILSLCVVFTLAISASAHEVSRSQSTLRVSGSEVLGTVTLDLVELGSVDVNRDDVVSFEELEPHIDRIYSGLKAHFSVGAPEPLVRTTVLRYDIVEDHMLVFQMQYTFERELSAITVTSRLHEMLRPDHRHFVSIQFANEVQQSVLAAASVATTFTAVAPPPRNQTIWRFLTLGVEHIITGYDHLAFLVCLLLATTTFWSLVRVITSFTIAHSITLALAIFDVVILPSRLVESVIALSIAYVAFENLLGVRVMDRSIVTFLFGLVHGFGFSTILREMDLQEGALALPLFSFNVGVEIGQIAFVAVMMPVLYLFNRGGLQALRHAVSLGIGVLAIYWFAQRAFLG